jgi:outer membrane lipoprotein SlyB
MSSIRAARVFGVALLPVLALGACAVAPPSGPDIVALPGHGKTFPQFRQDDDYCRNYAQSRISREANGVAANAQNNSVATAAAGTLLGAAAGAALGSLSGNVGAGAAVGAGAGLLGGAAVAGGNAQDTANSLQGRYDTAYAQCMVGYGNRIQQPAAPVVYGAPPPVYYGPPPGYYGPPPGYYAPGY